jgi:hypothetical protein
MFHEIWATHMLQESSALCLSVFPCIHAVDAVLNTEGTMIEQVLVPGEAKAIPYQGKLSVSAVKAFVVSRIPSHITTVTKPDELRAVLHACGAASMPPATRGAARVPQARWNLCAILVSDSSKVPPFMKAVALLHRGNVCVRLSPAYCLTVDSSVHCQIVDRARGRTASLPLCLSASLPHCLTASLWHCATVLLSTVLLSTL